MSDGFYRAFEDRHRGSRELIKSRLSVYNLFVQPLLEGGGEAKAVDLGCGRGEWLELITGLGFDAVGVDLDQDMLEACHELGLKVEKGDALSFLAALPDESQSIVSAFHVVEHVTFEQLQILVSQALRVLKPGGLLIMETPNPENIVVATRNFYLDPTHQRPIPPELLSFLPEYYGFARTKILRLQESKEVAQRTELTLQDVLGGASPDYAVVAQTAAAANVVSLLDFPFLLEYGLSLESLTARYQDQLSARLWQAETKAQQAETKAQHAETKAQHAETKAQQAETASNERLAQLQAVYASSSWRLTKPLRAIKRILGGDFSIFRRLTVAAKLKVNRGHVVAASTTPDTMTPRARQIYTELKAAIKKRKSEQR
jgi:O-antigen chain-terminating methyltransferase